MAPASVMSFNRDKCVLAKITPRYCVAPARWPLAPVKAYAVDTEIALANVFRHGEPNIEKLRAVVVRGNASRVIVANHAGARIRRRFLN